MIYRDSVSVLDFYSRFKYSLTFSRSIVRWTSRVWSRVWNPIKLIKLKSQGRALNSTSMHGNTGWMIETMKCWLGWTFWEEIIHELGLPRKTKEIENQPWLKKINLNIILTCDTCTTNVKISSKCKVLKQSKNVISNSTYVILLFLSLWAKISKLIIYRKIPKIISPSMYEPLQI